jgi:hypothetical protein
MNMAERTYGKSQIVTVNINNEGYEGQKRPGG